MENQKKGRREMKKALFIFPRNPFSGRYSGDVIRAKKFVEFLKSKYEITVITTENYYSLKKVNKITIINFKKENFFLKIIFIFFSIITLRPLTVGYFYSSDINNYVKKNISNFDVVFCQSIRVAQYVFNSKIKKKILDMGDLYSNNYLQTYKIKNIFNPSRIIYLIESILVRKFEKKCFQKFNKIFLFSKKEIRSSTFNKKKIHQIDFGIDRIKKKFRFNKGNYKIIFIGNIKYLPNKIACKNFIKNIFPEIKKVHRNVEFHVIGEISKFHKLLWERKNSIVIHGKVAEIESLLTKTICGLANLNVASGIQTKILTYMSYGIPTIASKQVFENFDAISSSYLPTYQSKKELINLILKLKKDKSYSQSVSMKSLKIVKKFKWNNVLKNLKI